MRQLRLVLAVVTVLLFSYALLLGGRYLLTLPDADLFTGDRPHAAREGDWPRGAFEVGRTKTAHDLAGAKEVAIRNAFGNVALAPGGSQVVVQQVTYARGRDRAEAEQRAKGVHVTVTRQGSELVVSVQDDLHSRNVGLNLTISLPPAVPVRAETSDGNISMRDLHGALTAKSASGDVSVAGAGDKVSASTVSGELRVEGAPKGVDLRTVSGDLTARQVSGDADAHSVSGGVTLEALDSRRIAVSSTSGDLQIATRVPFSGHLSARSVSGDVTITLPPGSDCQVHMKSVSGDKRDSLPSRAGAPGLVEAGTVSGDITIASGQ